MAKGSEVLGLLGYMLLLQNRYKNWRYKNAYKLSAGNACGSVYIQSSLAVDRCKCATVYISAYSILDVLNCMAVVYTTVGSKLCAYNWY